MIKIKYIFILCGQIGQFYGCPLCLSMPKNTEKPFFLDEKDEHNDNFEQLHSVFSISENTD